jgi:hypothetical protein
MLVPTHIPLLAAFCCALSDVLRDMFCYPLEEDELFNLEFALCYGFE